MCKNIYFFYISIYLFILFARQHSQHILKIDSHQDAIFTQQVLVFFLNCIYFHISMLPFYWFSLHFIFSMLQCGDFAHIDLLYQFNYCLKCSYSVTSKVICFNISQLFCSVCFSMIMYCLKCTDLLRCVWSLLNGLWFWRSSSVRHCVCRVRNTSIRTSSRIAGPGERHRNERG